MKAIDRFLDYLDFKGIKPTRFEKEAGLSNGYLGTQKKRNADLGEGIIKQIINYCLDLNPVWLLIGEGSMLKTENQSKNIVYKHIQEMETRPRIPLNAAAGSLSVCLDGITINQCEQMPAITPIYKPKQPEALGHYSIPLYDVAAAANLQTLFCNREQNILGEISIPNIPKCDGAVYISGDSMYPILKAGDIVAYKEIRDPANIIYGEMYLVSLDIEGDDYLTIKYINRSDIDQCVKLVSYNTYHQTKDIPITSIKALAIVKLSIRKNTM